MGLMIKKILICLLVIVSSCALAQDDTLATKRLNEVVIRSNRQGGTITRLPLIQGVNVWSGKKNEVVRVADMDANIAEKTGRQIFAKVPGVFVYDMDGSGNQVNISLRGLDPHRGWEFNIRKNGIMTNSDMYGYPASHYSIPMEAVERIEIVRGTGSLQYGAQFGGMLNYVTKQMDSTKKISFENITTAGSFGLLSSYNAIGGRIGKVQYMAYYQKRISNGYRDNSTSDSDAQGLILRWMATDNLTITGEIGRSSYLYRIPGPLTDTMFEENPRMSTRTRNYFNPDIYVPSLTLDWSLAADTRLVLATSAVLGARNSVTFDRPANVDDAIDPLTGQFSPRQVDIDNFRSYTSELKLLHHYGLFGEKHMFTAGVQLMNNDLHRRNLGVGTTGSDFDLTVNDAFGRDLHFRTKNVALFIENSFNLTERLSVNPGVRIEIGKSDMTGTIAYYDPGKLPNTISHNFPLFGVNAEYELMSTQNFYAGVSSSYRPVIFKDIIPASTYEVVDKNLRDARGYTLEAGYRGSTNSLTWDIGVFQMHYNDRLGSLAEYDADGNYYLYRTNIGNSTTTGAEAFVEYTTAIGRAELSAFTSTAYFDGRYTEAIVRSGETNVDVSGNKIESVPNLISRSGITLKYKNASLGCLYSYTSKSYADALNTEAPTANGAVGVVPSYDLFDINASYALLSSLALRLNINNVLDRQYYTKRPQFYPGPGVWPSDGRSVTASVTIKI